MTMTEFSLSEVADELDAVLNPSAAAGWRPRYNIAPTQPHVIVTLTSDARVIRLARWGLPPRGKVPMMINLRAERIASGGFRSLYEKQRCVVPADGFYEWTGPASRRRPIWFHRPEGGRVYFAGVFEASPAGADVPNFALITTSPNEVVASVHNRMPAIIPVNLVKDWLEGRAGDSSLGPAPETYLIGTPVSERANSPKNDDPSLILPVAI